MTDMFRQIAEAINIETVAADLGLSVNRAGYICCPLHVEKTPSCKLYPEQGRFFCYGCNKGGDSIDLVVAVMGCTKTEAATALNKRYALGFDLNQHSEKLRLRRKKSQSKQNLSAEYLKQMADHLADFYRCLIQHNIPHGIPLWFIERTLGDFLDRLLEDDDLRLSDPEAFYRKYRKEFAKYGDAEKRFYAIYRDDGWSPEW